MRLSFADDAGLASQGSKKIAELRGFDHDCASGLCSYTTTPLLAGPPVFYRGPLYACRTFLRPEYFVLFSNFLLLLFFLFSPTNHTTLANEGHGLSVRR